MGNEMSVDGFNPLLMFWLKGCGVYCMRNAQIHLSQGERGD
jgi:hypothetical protein